MDSPFKPVANEAINVRMALTGPAGSGKTFTSLLLATSMCQRVAGIDTERGRMKEHRRRFNFHHFAPNRFDPRDLVKLLGIAGAEGFDGIVIDSMTHYWSGTGGALEFVDSHEKDRGGKFSAGWKEYRPIENAMMEAILGYPGHVFVTMRVKTAYDIEKTSDGKTKPVKIGLRPDQREGVDYEFSIVGEMDTSHSLRISKSTCDDLDGAEIARPGLELASTIATWAGDGVKVPDALALRDRALDLHVTFDEIRALREEARDRGLLGAAVVDGSGDVVSLNDLIIARGNELRGLTSVPAIVGAAA